MTHKYIELINIIEDKKNLQNKVEPLFYDLNSYYALSKFLFSLSFTMALLDVLSHFFVYFFSDSMNGFHLSSFFYLFPSRDFLDIHISEAILNNLIFTLSTLTSIFYVVIISYPFKFHQKTFKFHQKKESPIFILFFLSLLLVIIASGACFLFDLELFYFSFFRIFYSGIFLTCLLSSSFWFMMKLSLIVKFPSVKTSDLFLNLNRDVEKLNDNLNKMKETLFKSHENMLDFYDIAKDASTSDTDQKAILDLFNEYDLYKNKNTNSNLEYLDHILNKHKHQININND